MTPPRLFGTLPSGEAIYAYTLSSSTGVSLEVITCGGIVTSLRLPDRHGNIADVVCGFERLAPYLGSHPYFGAIVGRIAGRVTGGRLRIDGCEYLLPCNEGSNHLHGGFNGLSRRIWTASPVSRPDGGDSLQLRYVSPDGEEGYPGTVTFFVTYSLSPAGAFIIETTATTDRTTPVSLTHHSYFNLAGEGSGSIAGHCLQIFATDYVPGQNGSLTLSGRRTRLVDQPADCNAPRILGDVLPRLFQQHGDLYLLRNSPPPSVPARAAWVVEPVSGRTLEVFTTESCLQFYSGAALDGTLVGKTGRPYGPHAAFCLECQGYPNSTTEPTFPDILVRPGRPQCHTTVYAFSIT